MVKKQIKRAALFAFCILWFWLCGCDGLSSGSSSAVSALSMPDRVEISHLDDETASAGVASNPQRGAYVAPPSTAMALYSDSGTDYSTTRKDNWAEDTQALDMVNDLLGVVQESGYEYLVNAGPYKALIRPVGESSSSQSGSSTVSSKTESLQEITLNVTRQSNTSKRFNRGRGWEPLVPHRLVQRNPQPLVAVPPASLLAGAELPGEPAHLEGSLAGNDDDSISIGHHNVSGIDEYSAAVDRKVVGLCKHSPRPYSPCAVSPAQAYRRFAHLNDLVRVPGPAVRYPPETPFSTHSGLLF